MVGEVTVDQPPGAQLQLVVGAPDALLAGGQPGEHPGDPFGLLGSGEPVRNEDDYPFTVAVGGHRSATALAAPHLDDRLARAGHYRLARPSFGFTLRR
ncbi:hypothetical protein KRMM14A1004_07290 [Krasilnikovia sp. MM14-A1004]